MIHIFKQWKLIKESAMTNDRPRRRQNLVTAENEIILASPHLTSSLVLPNSETGGSLSPVPKNKR